MRDHRGTIYVKERRLKRQTGKDGPQYKKSFIKDYSINTECSQVMTELALNSSVRAELVMTCLTLYLETSSDQRGIANKITSVRPL